MTGTKSHSFTEGPILSMMIKYTIPLILTNLLQVFYNIADNLIVGLSSEPDAIGAIGTTTAFINLVVNLFIGCSIGTKVVVAEYLGAKQYDKVHTTVHTSMTVALIFGVLASIIGVLISTPVLKAMGNQGRLLELASIYAKIYFLSVPFTAITNFAVAIIQAKGDTKTPLYILSTCGLTNVILNLFFVLLLKMDVDGVAIATVISCVLSSILLVFHLIKTKDACRLKIKLLRIDIKNLNRILTIGMPAAIQNVLFSFSHMLVQSSVLSVNNTLASASTDFQPVVKGCAVATSIEGIACTVVNSLGQGAVPFVAQNRGANNYARIKKGLYIWYAASFVMGILVAFALILLKDPLFSLYGIPKASSDPLMRIAYDSARTRMLIMFFPYFLLGFMEVGGAAMQGLGRSITASVTSLIGSCFFRIVWLLTIFTAAPSLETIFISFPISWLITALTHYIFASIEIKKHNNKRAAK